MRNAPAMSWGKGDRVVAWACAGTCAINCDASVHQHHHPMAIQHISSGQVVDVLPLGSRLASEKTVALFKSDQLEVIRLVLLAGKSLPPHSVAGEFMIQCIEGRIDVTTDGASNVLGAGQMLYMSARLPHGVVALEDSSALLTIVLHK